MKQFLNQIILYCLLLFSILFVFEIVTANMVVSNSNFKLKSLPKYLIIGHSHAALTYDDSLINNFKNLAESGESYFYTYHKIKPVIEHNKSISTVFIEFSNNNIDKKMDDWTWGDIDMSYRFGKFSPMIDIRDKLFLLYKNPLCYLKSMVVISKERIEQVWNGNLTYNKVLGGYTKVDTVSNGGSNIKEISEIEPIQMNTKNYKVSLENLKYLHKIIDILDNKGINTILVRSPQRSDYEFWKNEAEFQKIRKQQFGNLDFIDFSRFNLKADEYLNAAHLNSNGAERFSLWFNKMLNTGMLKREHRTQLEQSIL